MSVSGTCPNQYSFDTRTGAQSFACYAITAKVRTTRRVIRHFTRLNTKQPPPGVSMLTTRELEVFELITRGLSNAEIGRELFISDTTVKPTSPGCCRSRTSATGSRRSSSPTRPGSSTSRDPAHSPTGGGRPVVGWSHQGHDLATTRARPLRTYRRGNAIAPERSDHMIAIESLTKKYHSTVAVDHVSFVAEPGRVTGFLGPNGAGKSTSMRMLVGLTAPTSGTATISGRRFADLPNPGLEVGVMLDASAQHAGRTGREILTIAQRTMGVPARRVDEMLELVSLTEAEADRRVGNYSLGMRQRLGIATALIGNPGVLVLDEPANGLDPAGIRWMRDLLRDFANRGGTVLLSSHLLREVEIIADDIVMIGRGKVVCQGSKANLLRGVGSIARAVDRSALLRALHASGLDATVSDDGALATDADPARVGELALAAGVALTELRPAEGGLEDMFLELTADTQRDNHTERTAA
jgi:ABC-2 type transport system ATP-binding protein